ncbi:hypothetical protein V8G54_026889 [Vigna mungo]|uniref:Uncharacterized protein n=1 Tax=Vigna mungo TaxID=3915 RepID=A0AAQ3N1F1_VIGMU
MASTPNTTMEQGFNGTHLQGPRHQQRLRTHTNPPRQREETGRDSESDDERTREISNIKERKPKEVRPKVKIRKGVEVAVVVVVAQQKERFGNERTESVMGGALWGTRVMEIVKKHDSGGLVWKRIKLTTTRKANAKKRLLRVWQGFFSSSSSSSSSIITSLFFSSEFLLKNEAVLKACSQPSAPAPATANNS